MRAVRECKGGSAIFKSLQMAFFLDIFRGDHWSQGTWQAAHADEVTPCNLIQNSMSLFRFLQSINVAGQKKKPLQFIGVVSPMISYFNISVAFLTANN